MTRRTNRVAVTAILAAFLLSLGTARADAPFNPTQKAFIQYPYYSYGSTLSFDQVANDKAMTIKSYDMKIPAGWHVAFASPDPSSQTTCNGLTAANINASAERVGLVQLTLITDAIRGKAGALTLGGFLYHLSYDSPTDTATLCGRVATTNASLPAANREIMFQALLKHNPDGSGNLSWDYATVPGATFGSRSLFDADYFRDQHVSILGSSLSFFAKTDGNFNTNPAGAKTPVTYAWNPDAPGDYTFTGTYTPCGSGDAIGLHPAPFCSSSATPAPAVLSSVIRISDYPIGYHPGGKLTAPAYWSVQTSTTPTPFKWSQPATASNDQIKGYAFILYGDIAPITQRKSIYIITDAADPGVANPNPCGSAGTDAICTFNLDWTGLLTDGGQAMNSNAVFSANLVTIYQDGHRSDGKCDEGSTTVEKVAGKTAPCADNTVPAYDALNQTGTSYTQFLHRDRAWPLRYQKKIVSFATNDPANVMSAVFVLLVDFDLHQFEYVVWKPVGATFAGTGMTVNGSGTSGGQIDFSVLSGPVHWTLQAICGNDCRGFFVQKSSQTNSVDDIQQLDYFFGTPSVRNNNPKVDLTRGGAMTKV